MLLHGSETSDIEGQVKGTSVNLRQIMKTGFEFQIHRAYTLFWSVLQSLSRTSPSSLVDCEMMRLGWGPLVGWLSVGIP